MERGDDLRSFDEIFRDAQPSISLGPVDEGKGKPSGKVLGREFYSDSAGRAILGHTVTDQMGGGANPPEECECIVANLRGPGNPDGEFYYVESIDFDLDGQIALEQIATGGGDTCEDIGYTGSNDAGSLAFVDFLSPTATKWQLSLENGVTSALLYKDDGGDCPIASPVGSYSGGGYTAEIADDPF